MRKLWTILLYFLLVGVLVALAVPFLWMLSASFKEQSDIFRSPPEIVSDAPTMLNYVRLFVEYNFLRHFRNSVYIGVVQTLLNIFLSALAGFAFAKYAFRLKNFLFLVLLGSMMIPMHTTFVPLFQLAIKLNLVDKFAAVILPGVVGAFGIFFMRQHMESIPDELLDAGRIDGTSEFGAFLRIALPLVRPALMILAVISFINSWNNYVWPMIVIRSREMQPLPVMLAGLVGLYRMEHGILMAGAFLSALPVLLLFSLFQRYFVQGILQGAVRG